MMQQQTYFNTGEVCEKMLEIDSRIMYAGYLKSDGCLESETMRKAIAYYNELTIMSLPIQTHGDSIVLAVRVDSDISEVVSRAKELIVPH
jgi:hypothetical protein